ncbi:MAG: ABC transporter ATP-binding protein [Dehalococcoidales bacterium]|nr:ABC transporter ATP-binding protein [Dehalococcoidales bacterium]
MITLELSGVNKIYSGAYQTQVLFDINLSFEAKTCSAIVGESGSGKSTLMNIMGILDTPTSGEVTIASNLVSRMNRKQMAEIRNRTIGFVFQFHYLLPEFTVLENVLIPHLIHNRSQSGQVLNRARNLLDIVGIAKLEKRLPTQISGGEQQRTAIARALMNNPSIILADEPTGNLDSVTTQNVCRLFGEIKKEFNTTFIVVTHDRTVASHTDRIVEVRDGRIISDKLNTKTVPETE